MFKIDSPGATINNEWTEGNPSLGVPATVVSADFMNLALQDELVNLVETEAGITLDKPTTTQVAEAIRFLIQNGGNPTGGQPQTVLENADGPLPVTGLVFDKTVHIGAKVEIHIERETDTQNVQEVGYLAISHDTNDDLWRVSLTSNLDDAGVTFSITGAGVVEYTTDDLTGSGYSGRLTVGSITKFEQ